MSLVSWSRKLTRLWVRLDCARRRISKAPVRRSVALYELRPTTASVTRTGAVGSRKVGTILSRLSTLTSTISSLSSAFAVRACR